MSVQVVIGGLSLKAIVDTAAKVTLISDKVYTSLTPQPPKLQEVTLNTAEETLECEG